MTAPSGYTPPGGLVITPAMRAADDAGRDHLAAQVRQALDDAARGEREARERIRTRPPWWLAAEPGRST